MNLSIKAAAATCIVVVFVAPAGAQVTVPAGYIYAPQPLNAPAQGCVAAGPGGTFVGIGPGFTANAQSVVLAKESGEFRLVVSGFNSIGDCAYDAATDTLYVTDNADNDDLGLTAGSFSNTGAQTGDTVFAIPTASTASGLLAPAVELLPADSIGGAASVALSSTGSLLVGDAAGSGAGTVIEIGPGTSSSTLVTGLDFTGGIAVDSGGNFFVAELLNSSFENQISRFDAAGAPVAPTPFAGPSFGIGSFDLALDAEGNLIATGVFGGDVVAVDMSGTSNPFVSGLSFATGVTVDGFTGRVEMLSSTGLADSEEKSIHKFVRKDRLLPGKGSAKTECFHEFYGLELSGKEALCTDGAACDADGVVNNRCTFPVGFCLNVEDAAFPLCDAAGSITSFRIKTKPASLGLQDTAVSVSAALPVSGSACFFSDGLVVPLKRRGSGTLKDGKGRVQVKTETAAGAKDDDTVKLVCTAAPF